MRILCVFPEQTSSIDLTGWDDNTTLAELLAALAITPGDEVAVDTETVPTATPLSELQLLEGSRIAPAPVSRPQEISDWNVGVVGGLELAEPVRIPDHRPLTAGRSPQADVTLPTPSASWEHVRFSREDEGVRIVDAGSTNGTVVDGKKVPPEGVVVTEATTVLAGGSALLLRPELVEPLAPPPGSLRNITPAGTVPFNRPPRPGAPKDPPPLDPPQRKTVPDTSRFQIVTVLAPIAMAAGMVAVLGSWHYAFIALLSPVMAVGMWFEQKHRRKKNLAKEDSRFGEELDKFREAITRQGAQRTRDRSDSTPDPHTALRRALLPSTRLWQRRVSADDFLTLHLGYGAQPFTPRVDSGGKLETEVREAIDQARLANAPLYADAHHAGVIGIVGDRQGALALARSLVAQAAVHCGPADLTVGVFCDNGRQQEWDWCAWLPHTRQADGGPDSRWMSHSKDRSLSMLRGIDETGLPTPAALVVLDTDVLTEGRHSPARNVLGKNRGDAHSSSYGGPGSGGPGSGGPGSRGSAGGSGGFGSGGLGSAGFGEGAAQTRVSGIVIARSATQLPAACTTVVEVHDDAAATVRVPAQRQVTTDVVLSGISLEQAETTARNLAHFDDPELVIAGAALPSLIRTPELLDEPLTAAGITKMWRADTGVSTPVGVGEDGPLVLDLVKDGPHGLVGGTTGSGKSEFLRSFVAGLAARNDPTRLNFILIDFKGGAAFSACERLPHTIGTISNLDEQLADRALRALEAEMDRRQRLFAAAGEGVDNLPAYLATNPPEPLPRLLLVIDEFAMLAKDFPDVLASLVSVAAVGRTLGVHMVLATQRPAGVVNDDILANTNLRVALRVQSREDSSNVIGVPSAASISRSQMGRAYVKLGQDDITPVQTALVTGRAPIEQVHDITFSQVGMFGERIRTATPVKKSVESDLDVLIDAVREAHTAAGYAPPRQVWPPALGERVNLGGFDDTVEAADSEAADSDPLTAVPGLPESQPGRATVALVDEPELQRQSPAGWELSRGNLLLLGIPGSGTTTTLTSVALALAACHRPDELDIAILDAGGRGLEPLARLPHTVAYVGAGRNAREQQARFLRFLNAELARRRAQGTGQRPLVVLLDGFATLRDEFQDYLGTDLLDMLYRAYADGPAVGMHFAVSTTRARNVPSQIDEVTMQKWVFRLADAYDYSGFGLRGKDLPLPLPGRCVDTERTLQMHIATPQISTDEAIERIRARFPASEKPDVVGSLPTRVDASRLAELVELGAEPRRLPLGVREDTLEPAVVELYEGEHLFIGGTARSGRSTLLLALVQAIRTREAALPVTERSRLIGICDRRSPLLGAKLDSCAGSPEEIPALLASLHLNPGRTVLFVDDLERVADDGQALEQLLVNSGDRVLVVGAGKSAELRSLYSHWNRTLRKSRAGVLLQPDVDYDGDLLSTTLPRRAPVALTVGRGYMCVSGGHALIQAMSPDALGGEAGAERAAAQDSAQGSAQAAAQGSAQAATQGAAQAATQDAAQAATQDAAAAKAVGA